MPLGDLDFGVGYENHTSYPAPGQMILYPGGISETEILLAYGGVHFASKMGQLAGNHFITITSPLEDLPKLGKMTLWEGAPLLKAAFTYNTDILDSQTVAHLGEQFLLLLAAIAEQPDIHASELRSMLEQRYQAYKESRDHEYLDSARRKLQSARRRALLR